MGGQPPSGDQPPPGRPSGMPIARVAGITIRVHWSFLLLIGFIVAAGWSAGPAAIGNLLAWIGALFACVVLHELAHSIVARRRGATVLGIILLPIGGVSQIDKMPERPPDELAIAAVGPLTSFVLGIAFLGVALATGAAAWPPTLLAGSWWARLGWLNILLAAFNMLPALPMDGGRVLRAWLERRRDPLTATRLAGRIARGIAVVMIVAGLFYDLWLIFIGIFVFLGAAAEEQAAARSAVERWQREQMQQMQPPGAAGAAGAPGAPGGPGGPGGGPAPWGAPPPWSGPGGGMWPVPGYPPPTMPPPATPPPGWAPGRPRPPAPPHSGSRPG